MTGGEGGSGLWLVVVCVAVLACGVLLGWFLARRGAAAEAASRLDAALAQARAEGLAEVATARERARGLEAERQQLLDDLRALRQQGDQWREALDGARDDKAQFAERAARIGPLQQEVADAAARLQAQGAELSAARARVAQLETLLEAERTQAQEKLDLLRNAETALSNQFKSLANDILEEKSKRFTEQNQANLGQLLDPLKLKLQDFQGKVELFYDAEGKQRSALAQQVTQLMDLNRVLSDEAKNLTQALKGSSKTQGNWGELILERVLEASGLRRGVEYHVQQSHVNEEGRRLQPDVVIHLPEERRLVVDAKVSLIAYEECVRAETDELRAAAQRRHLASIRQHIDGLSGKRYQNLYALKSLDFVLMFVPIEPAFMLAVAADEQLFMDAWQRNVLLVSPSTLLFVVRTVAHLWRQEAQSRNAQDIAKRGAELYDKLAAFVGDLEKVGKSLDSAKGAYDDAFKRFVSGNGNAIRQAEMLKQLGVKPSKAFSAAALDVALPEAGLPDGAPTPPLLPRRIGGESGETASLLPDT
ncbi:MAG: DNA recombination protein RmuC [Pseudomonadota bacterium]